MKVAIIHDWCVIYGGAERVLENIIDCFPDADLFTLIDFVPEHQRNFLRGKKPKTSFLQKIPGVKNHYRKLLALMPLAIEQFDLSKYDLIISSSYCVAKGVLTGPNQIHISYCHSPMRYAWDHYNEYLKEMKLDKGVLSWAVRLLLHKVRTWDVRSSNTVDKFIANSSFVKGRIKKFYRRNSDVLFPPVDTSIFTPVVNKKDYYVTAGRFVPFKRLDIAIRAFANLPDKKLIVLGDGPDMEKLKSMATSNIKFTGFLSPDEVHKYMRYAKGFIFPSEEDFGILPVEAQACGTPVIAYGSGGALETVVPLNDKSNNKIPTGVFFNEQTKDSLINAIDYFEKNINEFDANKITKHANSFGNEVFKKGFRDLINKYIEELTINNKSFKLDKSDFKAVAKGDKKRLNDFVDTIINTRVPAKILERRAIFLD